MYRFLFVSGHCVPGIIIVFFLLFVISSLYILLAAFIYEKTVFFKVLFSLNHTLLLSYLVTTIDFVIIYMYAHTYTWIIVWVNFDILCVQFNFLLHVHLFINGSMCVCVMMMMMNKLLNTSIYVNDYSISTAHHKASIPFLLYLSVIHCLYTYYTSTLYLPHSVLLSYFCYFLDIFF